MTTLSDRVALVTGGRRIGSAVALALAGRGADVALCYNRSRDEAEEAAAAIRQLGRRAAVMQADLSDPAACRRFVGDSVEALGRLDVLVNMASVYLHKAFDDLTDDDFERGLAVDLRAAFACAHAARDHLRASGRGRIINFSDWVDASRRPRYTGYLPYYVAKMGVIGLTEALALELASDGVLVNAIAPGPILAPPGTTDEEYQAVVRATPLGRWGGAEEIVKAVLFLIDSDFVTGETIRVDGGRHVK
jgi:NAD(P)-dependent dehydrogenase (short-subunit alcohol dehydrogenase family)